MLQLYQQKGDIKTPNIKPVSDLRNYNEVLKDIIVGEPVFLMKNGRDRYATLDTEEYEKMQVSIELMSEFIKGEKSGKENGWLTVEEVKASLGMKDE